MTYDRPANVLMGESAVHVRAELATKEAVRKALPEHAREGRPAYVW
jgi:hypothetical protein